MGAPATAYSDGGIFIQGNLAICDPSLIFTRHPRTDRAAYVRWILLVLFEIVSHFAILRTGLASPADDPNVVRLMWRGKCISAEWVKSALGRADFHLVLRLSPCRPSAFAATRCSSRLRLSRCIGIPFSTRLSAASATRCSSTLMHWTHIDAPKRISVSYAVAIRPSGPYRH